MLYRIIAIVAVLSFAGWARADAPATGGQAYAVILVGAPGSPMYARHYADRVTRFTKVLNDAGVAADRLTVLPGTSTASAVIDAVSKAVAKPTADDQFILILIGHGELNESGCTLQLTGPDLQIAALADAIKPLKAHSQIVLNFSSVAGDAVKLFVQPGRVNIAGSSPGQVNDNDFAEFFLEELEKKTASRPLLDVYNAATQGFARWIVRQKSADGEGQTGWIVEGRTSAAVFKKLYDAPDVPANRKFTASPASDADDVIDLPLVADSNPFWANRRLISENPSIDDSGATDVVPASALSAKGFASVMPSPTMGKVAARTVLGQPLVKLPTTVH
ncbi:hypothetical protein BH10PLA1_BH10PLA1_12350 [soil metagenome]